MWASGPRSQHRAGWDDALAWYVADRGTTSQIEPMGCLTTLQSDRVQMRRDEDHGPEGSVYAALVDQAKRGDREAFDSLARLTGDRCMAIAFRILRDFDLADDAVQSALLTAWREIRALRDPLRFEPWLHRILTHACYAEAKRRRRRSEGIWLSPVAPVHGPDDYATVDNRDQLERAFRRLTIEQRTVLVFHHYLGLSLPEVAARIGIPLGTVKSRMHHAKRALRASLDAEARSAPTSQERLA